MLDTVKADLARLSHSGTPSLRTLVAGLLSQGFQAILVYRLFHWLQRKGFSGQPLRFVCERFIEITTGIPAVSTAVGGVPELLEDGVGGFLAPVGDVACLSDNVLRLLDDAELLAKCGLVCRERIETDFSFERRVRMMEEYYDFFNRA